MPERVQLRRTKGYRKPEHAVVVARPSKWGNPYPVKVYGEEAVAMYERAVRQAIEHPWSMPNDLWVRNIADSLDELRGKDLACWCGPTDVCHADVLLDLANRNLTSAPNDEVSA